MARAHIYLSTNARSLLQAVLDIGEASGCWGAPSLRPKKRQRRASAKDSAPGQASSHHVCTLQYLLVRMHTHLELYPHVCSHGSLYAYPLVLPQLTILCMCVFVSGLCLIVGVSACVRHRVLWDGGVGACGLCVHSPLHCYVGQCI